MRIFDHPNLKDGWKCPICQTDEDKPITLIGIRGTEQENLIEAEQFHVDCLEFTWFKENNIIAMLPH